MTVEPALFLVALIVDLILSIAMTVLVIVALLFIVWRAFVRLKQRDKG